MSQTELTPDAERVTPRAAADTREVVIRVRGLRKQLGGQQIFDGLDLDVYRGEILGVVGGSGTGKSVLLRCITGLLTPDAGEISIFETSATGRKATQRLARTNCWGVLFQDGALFSSLTVRENIEVPMREQLGLPRGVRRELAMLKLALVGLPPDSANKYPSQLSGGMRKRAGLARALALDPQIVFLDEPTSGLDPIGAEAFDQLILSLQQTLGLTVFMITHDLDSIFTACDRVAVLADHTIVREGSPPELVDDPGHPWVEDYFCGERARVHRGQEGEN
jgi:phospholipid/cholesterol/gamma-HCH transport system ATP-binding protein